MVRSLCSVCSSREALALTHDALTVAGALLELRCSCEGSPSPVELLLLLLRVSVDSAGSG